MLLLSPLKLSATSPQGGIALLKKKFEIEKILS
jgi:hypothetical protein